MSEETTIDLEDEDASLLLEIYIKDNFTKESYDVFKTDNNGYMIAASNALLNESIVSILKEKFKDAPTSKDSTDN